MLPNPVTDLFYHAIMHGCVWNSLLVPDSFFEQVLFEGSGGVLALACYVVLHFG